MVVNLITPEYKVLKTLFESNYKERPHIVFLSKLRIGVWLLHLRFLGGRTRLERANTSATNQRLNHSATCPIARVSGLVPTTVSVLTPFTLTSDSYTFQGSPPPYYVAIIGLTSISTIFSSGLEDKFRRQFGTNQLFAHLLHTLYQVCRCAASVQHPLVGQQPRWDSNPHKTCF